MDLILTMNALKYELRIIIIFFISCIIQNWTSFWTYYYLRIIL